MIRKDVKLGFAIGGVLLAVLVVYVLVGTGGDERAQNNGAPIVTEDTSQSAASHTAAPPNSNSPNTHDVPQPVTGATGATGAVADASHGSGSGTIPPATDTAPPVRTEVAAAQEHGDPNHDLWGKVLNEGHLLMSETPTPVGGMSARPIMLLNGGRTGLLGMRRWC